ncbi:MAG: CbiQ family ECF transporter T component, partial [Micromonosporaceae bacterium]
GALFVRAFERGERVYLAMVSRGYTGRMPALAVERAPVSSWLAGLTPAVLAAAVLAIAVARAQPWG